MSSDFWTTKSYLPYQSHNFQVEFKLYAIKPDAFYEQSPDTAATILNTPKLASSIDPFDVEEITIPSHAVKSIDMPTFEIGIEDVSGQLSEINPTEGREPNYQDIVVTFYAVDTDYGNIIDLLPRIFYTYYLNFNEETATSSIPFLVQFDKDAPEPNQGYVGSSYINVNLFKGSTIIPNPLNASNRAVIGLFGGFNNPLTTKKTLRIKRGLKDRRSIVYRNIAPISYDIGNLSYEESGIVECQMTFKYNLQEGNFGTAPGLPNGSGEIPDEPS